MTLPRVLIVLLASACCGVPARAFDRPDVTFKVFQFSADKIPRIDGDASGGPFIDKGQGEFWNADEFGAPAVAEDKRVSVAEANWAIQGVHARNHHIFTPAVDKDWRMA